MLVTDRRLLLAALSASLVPAQAWAALTGSAAIRLGPARAFSFETVRTLARKGASQPYKAPEQRAAQIIKGIDFDAAQKIKFRADHALWRGTSGADPVSFFHLSRYSADPVVLRGTQAGLRSHPDPRAN